MIHRGVSNFRPCGMDTASRLSFFLGARIKSSGRSRRRSHGWSRTTQHSRPQSRAYRLARSSALNDRSGSVYNIQFYHIHYRIVKQWFHHKPAPFRAYTYARGVSIDTFHVISISIEEINNGRIVLFLRHLRSTYLLTSGFFHNNIGDGTGLPSGPFTFIM